MGVDRDVLSRLAALERIVVYDLEFTAWEGSVARRWSGPGEHREVVQIGAVLVSPVQGFAELDALSLLVRPRVNPVLGAYFTNLTGITQEAVDRDGLPFPTALDRFLRFAEGAGAVLAHGSDAEVLAETCALNGLDPPAALATFENLRPLVARAAGSPVLLSSGDLHRHFPTVPRLAAHDALADARMVAATLRHIAAAMA